MISVDEAKRFTELTHKYWKTGKFEDILCEALQFNEPAFDKTMVEAEEGNEWNVYYEECIKLFRDADIVDIAKVVRKELKKAFNNEIKFSVRTSRGYYDGLYITIKEIKNEEKYLTPLDEYMSEYSREYLLKYGMEHPYTNDEYFRKCSINDIDRLKKEVYDKIVEIANLYKYDNSDIMVDYFDFNYNASLKMELIGSTGGSYLI